jgi:type IV fimbrial biogenesis protein FimT
MLVALLILALLAGLALPSFRSLRANALLGAAANQLLLDLSLARSLALTRGTTTLLCLTDAASRCLQVAGAGAAGYRLQLAGPPLEILHSQTLAAGLQLRATRPALTYYPWPRAGTTQTYTLCDPQADVPLRQVVVSQTGRARVQRSLQRGCP